MLNIYTVLPKEIGVQRYKKKKIIKKYYCTFFVKNAFLHFLAAAQLQIVRPAVQFFKRKLSYFADGLHNPHELVGLIQRHNRSFMQCFGCKAMGSVCPMRA